MTYWAKLAIISSILIITVLVGTHFFSTLRDEVESNYVVVSDSEEYEGHTVFEAVTEFHQPLPGGRELYLDALRLHLADLITFEQLIDTFQYVLIHYGHVMILMEPGMFDTLDTGPLSRFQVLVQHNRERDDAFVVALDLEGGAPYDVNLLFRGSVQWVSVSEEDSSIVIHLLDESSHSISWSDAGVF